MKHYIPCPIKDKYSASQKLCQRVLMTQIGMHIPVGLKNWHKIGHFFGGIFNIFDRSAKNNFISQYSIYKEYIFANYYFDEWLYSVIFFLHGYIVSEFV